MDSKNSPISALSREVKNLDLRKEAVAGVHIVLVIRSLELLEQPGDIRKLCLHDGSRETSQKRAQNREKECTIDPKHRNHNKRRGGSIREAGNRQKTHFNHTLRCESRKQRNPRSPPRNDSSTSAPTFPRSNVLMYLATSRQVRESSRSRVPMLPRSYVPRCVP
jgi:hypothetical protein